MADDADHRFAHGFGPRGVAARLFLDHPLEHRVDEGHAGGLDGLQVARREEPGQGGIARAECAVGQDVGRGADARPAAGAHGGRGVGQFQQVGAGGGHLRQVVDAVGADLHQHRAGAGHMHAADQEGCVGVGGQGRRGFEGMLHVDFFLAWLATHLAAKAGRSPSRLSRSEPAAVTT